VHVDIFSIKIINDRQSDEFGHFWNIKGIIFDFDTKIKLKPRNIQSRKTPHYDIRNFVIFLLLF
jgi:hypothetical protein